MKNEIKNLALSHKRVLGKDFLQSSEWRKFQESVGRKTHYVENDGPASSAGMFSVSIIEHNLLIVGKYFYVPRGPVFLCHSESRSSGVKNLETNITNRNVTGSLDELGMTGFNELVDLAKKENAGWIRIDLENEKILDLIRKNTNYKIAKAPHDMQPKEIFVMDITKSEEELLAEMKSKTRYNIKLSQKQGVVVKVMSNDKFPMTNQCQNPNDKNYCIEEFLRLTKEMAKRQGIATHPEKYYRKMIEVLPEEMLKIYVTEYEGKIIAANLMLFYGDTAIYLHGASSNEHRNVMAPFLLQWQAILDAKEKGYPYYDFGGIMSQKDTEENRKTQNWAGITTFKLGFSPNTKPVVFSGSYDIIIAPFRYWLYRGIQKLKSFVG